MAEIIPFSHDSSFSSDQAFTNRALNPLRNALSETLHEYSLYTLQDWINWFEKDITLAWEMVRGTQEADAFIADYMTEWGAKLNCCKEPALRGLNSDWLYKRLVEIVSTR